MGGSAILESNSASVQLSVSGEVAQVQDQAAGTYYRSGSWAGKPLWKKSRADGTIHAIYYNTRDQCFNVAHDKTEDALVRERMQKYHSGMKFHTGGTPQAFFDSKSSRGKGWWPVQEGEVTLTKTQFAVGNDVAALYKGSWLEGRIETVDHTRA